MKYSSQKGFTLIELLVVIAIIGILSSVVLASLTSARSKGTDAAIQSAMSNMRAQAELYYSSNGNSYGPALGATTCPTASANTNIFASTTTGGLWNLIQDVEGKAFGGATKVSCANVAGTAWGVVASTSNGLSWCVDSAGVSKSGALNSTTGLCF